MPPVADQFAAIINQATVGIAQVDLRGRFQLVNPAYCAITGRSERELLQLGMQDITHPDDLPGNVALFHACATEGRGFTIEKRYVKPNGTPVWVENSVSLLRDPDGAPSSILAVSHDIGRRKMAEADLLDAEARYHLVGRATNDVLWDWDHRSGRVVWSESMSAVFGYRAADATGPIDVAMRWWRERIHPEERETVVANFLATTEDSTETWAKEYRFRAADGTYRHVMDRGYIARGAAGEPVRIVGSMQDITPLRRAALERERLLSELEGERKTLETVLRQLPAGVIVADSRGRLVFSNPQVERIWRHPLIPSSNIQEYAHWQGFHPDGTPLRGDEWALARALLNGEVVADEVVHFERGDGSGRGVMHVSASPIDDGAGGRVGAVVVFTDITDREHLYEMTRAAQLQSEAASRVKDEFLAMLSHELRTPLNAILGWTHMLSTDSVAPDKLSRVIGIIHRNARAQAQMVEDLLDVSSIIRGKMRLQRADVDLRPIVAAAVDSVRPMAQAKHLELTVDLEQPAFRVHGDAARLQQILWNLLSNAIKFTPEGGRVEVGLHRLSPDAVQVVVRDSGDGIDPAFLPHVFDRFRQGDVTTTRAHGGLGLGLSIVRHLAEAHGGTVEAQSDGRGRGATFTVTLPSG